MLKIIDDLPDDILGLEAVGEVTADDYRSVLVPALESMLAKQPKARLLYVLGPGFEGFSGGAAWQDARVGMKHFTAFDRVAVVTDTDWIRKMVEAFGFAMPGEVETFETAELDRARSWISERKLRGELEFDLDREAGVLTLRPHDDLEAADFAGVAEVLDPYIDREGRLNGLVVVADEFPGWDSLSAITSHFRFVPRLAKHFVDAEVRRFDKDAEERARAWAAAG
jgi:hypothetical protein